MDSAQPITIRPATRNDIPQMMSLESQSQSAAHWSEKQYEGLFRPNAPVALLALVAEGKGQADLLGFLVARHLAPEWELENVVVAPECRRRGIGTRLMQELITRAQQANTGSVFLEVRESNASARAFYKKLGFHETGRRKAYYSNPTEDAVLCCKTLQASTISE
ncbi:MAG TPA: ribosomal protein S18-alanine N-acetyltransferase [Candidatus Sulfotelmatobacter sp.]|nr:ribosomal protein S18-alanine N-acetyltransferase [Candidatus Sulfotelmatobacter sp.]